MPVFNTQPLPFKAPKKLEFNWDNFKGGLNNLFRENEIAPNELSQAKNIMLVGQGVPTKAWGTGVYFLSSPTGSVRGLKGFYQKDGTNQLLSISDHGLLTKKSNASYTEITGVSWVSGNNAEMVQLNNSMYIVNGQRELARYSNPTLVGFPTIGQPSAVFATQISGVSGTNTLSYRLSHISNVGETLSSDAFTLANQPLDPKNGAIKIQWTNVSTASGIRIGTNIYGRDLGNETFLASVDAIATQYIDDGSSVPRLFAFVPGADSTGGPVAKYIERYTDRLIFAGIANDPTMLLISGRVPNHEKFDFGSGGGFVRIEPDSGDDITGLKVIGDKIIVFKQKSIWQVEITQVQIGNFYLIEPKYQLITGSVGCASSRTIVQVEDDVFFLAKGSRGVYVVGYEPNILNVLRTNEISVKVRPYFQNLTPTQEIEACATYYQNKYCIAFPGKNEIMVFDRERTAWLGPWTFDGRIFETYFDSDDRIRLLIGEDENSNIDEISSIYPGHKGVAMTTNLRTRKDDFKDWSSFKNIEDIFTKWRNVSGSVDVDIRLEKKNGTTVTSKDFTVTTSSGNSGWGADMWGSALWGDSEQQGEANDLAEIIRHAVLQQEARSVQLIVKTENLNDNYELLGVKTKAQEVGPGFTPASWRVY